MSVSSHHIHTPKILSSSHFPFHTRYNAKFSHRVTLGLGSNQGQSMRILELVFQYFTKHSRIQILWSSPVWKNPPFGYTQQNDFYNAVLVIATSLNVREMYALIFYVERRFGRGRKRAFKNAPRTLDIDLIFFDALRLKLPHLQIPHRDYANRPSVMLPLSFLEIRLGALAFRDLP